MSTKFLWPMWELPLTPARKLVGVSLADQANDEGECWPGIPSLQTRTGLSERAIQEALAWLEKYLVITRGFRAGRSTLYRVHPSRFTGAPRQTPAPGAPPSESAPPHQAHPAPAAGTPAPGAPTPAPGAPTPAGGAPITITDSSKGTFTEPTRASAWSEILKAWPKREGSLKASAGRKAYEKALQRNTHVELLAAVKRYAAFCVETKIVGQRWVMQPATFFEEAENLRDWTPHATSTFQHPDTEDGWCKLGRKLKISAGTMTSRDYAQVVKGHVHESLARNVDPLAVVT